MKLCKCILFICMSLIILSGCNISNQSTNSTSNNGTLIRINNVKTEIEINEEIQIIYDIFPDESQSVDFTSSNSSVASIDNNGVVRGISEGSTTITVSLRNSMISDSIVINVVNKIIGISQIEITNKIDSLYQDETYQLSCTILPSNAIAKELFYSSSIPSIASIDSNGKIFARLPGTTTIKVSSIDNKVFDSFDLTIKKRLIHVESVKIKNDKNTLVEGENLKLEVEVLPSNATNKDCVFTSLTPDYISVDENGVVNALKPTNGQNAIIEVKTIDQNKVDTIEFEIFKKEISVESISLSIVNKDIIPGDEILYDVNVIPADADDKTYTLSTTTPEIISIDVNGKIVALSQGKGDIIVTSNDGGKEYLAIVNVDNSSSFSEIKSILDQSLLIEKEYGKHGSLYFSSEGLVNENKSIDWTVYLDSIQKHEVINNEKTTTLTYRDELTLYDLIDSPNNVELKSSQIGDENWNYSEEEANDSISLVSLSNSIGLSNYVKSLLDDYSLFNLSSDDKGLDQIRIVKKELENIIIFDITKKCEYKAVSFDEKYSYFELAAQFVFNENLSINSFSYAANRYSAENYNQEEHKIIEGATPSNIEICQANIEYGERVNSDEQKISINDYKITSFEIDTSNFVDSSSKSVIYLGETKNIELTKILPTKHLDSSFTIQVNDNSIIKNVSYGNTLAIKGVNLGTTIVTIVLDDGIEDSIEITVIAPPVRSISLDYFSPIIYEGDSLTLKATVLPTEVSDNSYSMFIKESETNVASLSKNNDGTYTFNALNEGSVTVVAYSNADSSIKCETIINVKKLANANQLKEVMCESTYYTNDTELVFNIDGTGTLKLQGGGEYEFNWDVDSSLQIQFSSIIVTKLPDKWYDFKGTAGSYLTDNQASKINLIIYDLDYNYNVSLQLSK